MHLCLGLQLVGAAIGAAMAGLRPIVEITPARLSLRVMDQIVNNAAKLRYMSNGTVHRADHHQSSHRS